MTPKTTGVKISLVDTGQSQCGREVMICSSAEVLSVMARNLGFEYKCANSIMATNREADPSTASHLFSLRWLTHASRSRWSHPLPVP